MKIALVSYDVFQGKTTGAYPPLHLLNLATSLKLEGYEVRVFDYASSFQKINTYFNEIKDFSPTVAGFTCYTPYLGIFHSLTKQFRECMPKITMVFGGGHPTALPEKSLSDMPQFDYAMQGECDLSIVSFARMVEGTIEEKDVLGLVYKKNGEIVSNPRDFIKNLNDLPQIDRSFLNDYYKAGIYWDMAARGTLDMMITSRGCPYDCSFCFKLERKSRLRNPEHLMVEFESLRKRGIQSIHIQDDAFTSNKKRCLAIAEGLIKGSFKFDLKVRSRVNLVNEELLRTIKKAGVKQIIYGFESGSQKMLDSMNKRTTVLMNTNAITLTKKVGITCYGEIMIGMPGETKETIDETISFLLKNKPIIGFVPTLYPLPGTKVYEEAKKNKTLKGDWTIDGEVPWIKLPWTNSKSDLEEEAVRISQTVQKDIGTIFYFFKNHLRLMSLNQVKVLFGVFKTHIKTIRLKK